MYTCTSYIQQRLFWNNVTCIYDNVFVITLKYVIDHDFVVHFFKPRLYKTMFPNRSGSYPWLIDSNVDISRLIVSAGYLLCYCSQLHVACHPTRVYFPDSEPASSHYPFQYRMLGREAVPSSFKVLGMTAMDRTHDLPLSRPKRYLLTTEVVLIHDIFMIVFKENNIGMNHIITTYI